MKYFDKKAMIIVPLWGGRSKNYIAENVPVLRHIQPQVGYTNILGLVPWPDVGIRFGGVNGGGISLGTAGIGISNAPSRSFKQRDLMPALLDSLVNKLEDR